MWFLNPTQFMIQGQWWSIFRTQVLHTRQWWHRSGLYLKHHLQCRRSPESFTSFVDDDRDRKPSALAKARLMSANETPLWGVWHRPRHRKHGSAVAHEDQDDEDLGDHEMHDPSK